MSITLANGKIVETKESALETYLQERTMELESLDRRIASYQERRSAILAELSGLASEKDLPKSVTDILAKETP